MTSPYHFYFFVVPRRTSNLREVRFGEVVVLKQILVLHRENSWKFPEYLFDLRFLVHIPQVISKLSLVLHFFYLSNRRSSTKSIFVSYSVLTDFCHYLCLPLDRFLFEFFWSRNFWGSCYSSICFICGVFEFETEPKGLIYYCAYANGSNRIVWSFVWRKFSSVGNGEWWDEMKYGQKLKLGDAHVTPRNVQEVQASKLGDAPEAPLLHRQKLGHL
jgi:hypothetical protein